MAKYPIILSAFLLGLSGGFGHCIGMCHPFVLHISTKFSSSQDKYYMLVPHLKYNIGRTITYTFMGGIIGGIGNLSLFAGNFETGQKWLTIFAGILLILFGIFNIIGKHIPIPQLFKNKIGNINAINSPLLFGIMLGFLPCGLVVGALITSAVSTNIITGALSMMCFGIGTTFSLMILAIFGGTLLRKLPFVKWIFILVMICTGGYFVYLGILF